MPVLIPLFLIAWQSAQAALPVPPATIRGQVVNGRTLAPIADARVAVSETGQSTRTAADGRFELGNVKPGAYTLTVSTVGFIFVRRPITIADGAGLELTVPLAEGTGTYEESVRVEANAAADVQNGVSSVELSSAALQDLRDVAADDPVRALQALPGAQTGDDFRAEFSVRGSAFRHVGIVIDGTATSLLFHTMGGIEDPGSIAMINTDILERASLSAGVHPQPHGDWIGATLAFDIREGSRDRQAVRVAVSGTNASTVIEGPLGSARKGSWLVSVRKSYVDWLVRKISPDIESTVGFTDTQAKVGYDLTPRQHLSVLFIGGRAIYQKQGITGANEINRAHSQSGFVTATWRYTLTRLLLKQQLSYGANDFLGTGRFVQRLADGDTQTLSWRGDGSFFTSSAWRLNAGLKAQQFWFGQTLRDFVTQGNGVGLRTEQGIDGDRAIASGWGEIVRDGGTGSLSVGARVSTDSATNATRAAPWVVGERNVGAMRVFGAVGGANQFPTLEQLGQTPEGAVPEQAWGADLGAAGVIGGGVRWRVGVFQRRESDILRRVDEDRLVDGKRVTESRFPVLASTIDGTARGVDVVVERRAEHGPTGWVGYTWSHTSDRDVETGETFDGDFDQRHTLNVFVQQRLSYRMKASAKLRVGSNFPIVGYLSGTPPDSLVLGDTRNQVRLPTYARFDLSGSRTFTFTRSRLTLFVEFVNLLSHKNFGPGNGSIRANLTANNYTDRLLPFIPSAGFLLEF